MIGIDLVDLQQASMDSNWMRRGFLKKLFTDQEQQYIMLASQPSEMVWVLWSMKEAVYKIYNRTIGVRQFAPCKLRCRLNGNVSTTSYHGEVRIDNHIYYTSSEVLSGDYVHSIATVTPTDLDRRPFFLFTLQPDMDYKAMKPRCVSHHGRYLALIF